MGSAMTLRFQALVFHKRALTFAHDILLISGPSTPLPSRCTDLTLDYAFTKSRSVCVSVARVIDAIPTLI